MFLFGKLPAHGDFVARGLSAQAQAAWDDWASAGLEGARERLADAFDAAHDAAPPWRFVTRDAAGLDGWSAGAMACSVDSARRRFVAVLGVSGLDQEQAMDTGERLATAAEDGLYDALASAKTADVVADDLRFVAEALDASTADADNGLDAATLGTGLWWTTGPDGEDLVLRDEPLPPSLWSMSVRTPALQEAAQ